MSRFGGDLEDAGGQLGHEPAIVSDEDQGSVVGLERLDQSLDGFEIEVVGGFVEDQDVGVVDGESGEDQPSGLAAGEARDLFLDLIAREEHLGELGADPADGLAGTGGAEPALHGALGIREEFAVILGEVAREDLVTPLDGSGIGLEMAHDDLEQGGLADPVGSDDRQSVAAAEVEGDPVEDLLVAEGLGDSLDLEDLLAARALLREPEDGVASRRSRKRFDHQLFDLLDLALGLSGLGVLGPETIDKRLVVGDLLLAFGDLRLFARSVPVSLASVKAVKFPV